MWADLTEVFKQMSRQGFLDDRKRRNTCLAMGAKYG